MPRAASGFGPLARFHCAVGGRLAAVALVPAFAAGFGAGMLLGVDFLNTLARLLFGADGSRPARSAGALWIALVTIGAARTAAPRVCRGLSGWIRHLPADGVAHRRAAALAILVAQLPLLALLAVLAPIALQAPGRRAAAFAGLLLAAAAAALFAVPVARPALSRPPALAAAFLAGTCSWPGLAAAAVLLVAGDLAAGPLPAGAGGGPAVRRWGRGSAPPRWLAARIAWRALGWRLAGAYAVALLPVGAAAAFVAHNALPPGAAGLASRLGGGAGVVLFLAQAGEALAAQRPVWPWSRSLAQSAASRVGADALFLGCHAAPIALLAACIAPSFLLAAAPLAAALPFLSLRAAGALRRAPERKTGAAGEILLEGMWLAAAIALLPWTSPALAAAAPWAARRAAERERRQKVSRWLPIHHLAAGDPQSWSAS